jgi:hypothetical protein
MLSLILIASLSLSPLDSDTTIKIPVSEVKYIVPCTWRCSCDWSKVHTGWTILWKGKVYHSEGDRKDGKETPTLFYNPNKK